MSPTETLKEQIREQIRKSWNATRFLDGKKYKDELSKPCGQKGNFLISPPKQDRSQTSHNGMWPARPA